MKNRRLPTGKEGQREGVSLRDEFYSPSSPIANPWSVTTGKGVSHA